MVVCINAKLAIGKSGELLYHISNDLTNFKRLTEGGVVIMGRETLESLPNGKPLPNRENIILTKRSDYELENALIAHSISDVLELCDNPFWKNKKKFIIGGGSVYKEFLDAQLVRTIVLTEVDEETEGDTYFPELDEKQWKTIFQTEWMPVNGKEYKYRYKFIELQE